MNNKKRAFTDVEAFNKRRKVMNEKILLVEDNETIILGLTYLFKEEKFNLEIAKTR